MLKMWNEIFNNTTDKGITYRIDFRKHLYIDKKEKITQLFKEWTKDLNMQFIIEDIWISKEYTQKSSILLDVSELQIKTSMRFCTRLCYNWKD